MGHPISSGVSSNRKKEGVLSGPQNCTLQTQSRCTAVAPCSKSVRYHRLSVNKGQGGGQCYIGRRAARHLSPSSSSRKASHTRYRQCPHTIEPFKFLCFSLGSKRTEGRWPNTSASCPSVSSRGSACIFRPHDIHYMKRQIAVREL